MKGDMISVAICSYNRADNLRRALLSVTKQETDGFHFEIVVIDDGSTDNTADVVHEIAAQAGTLVRYVFEGSRRGIATARNRAVSEASGNYVVFFDDDQLAQPDWLKQLMAVVREKNAELVGGARNLDLLPEQIAKLGPVCRGLLGENLYAMPPALLEGKELPSTGNLLISRIVFEAVGAFDPRFVASGEDSDFLRRAREKEFVIWTAPKALVAHMIPAYRLTPAYFRWVSLRWGNQFASLDFTSKSYRRLLMNTAARSAQALMIHLPRLLSARLRADDARALDCQCLVWRALGYIRSALSLAAPRLFPQHRFQSELAFRREREFFAATASQPPAQ